MPLFYSGANIQQTEKVQDELWLLTGQATDAVTTAATDLTALNVAFSALLQAAASGVNMMDAFAKILTEPVDEPVASTAEVTSDWDSRVSADAIRREIDRRDRVLGILSYILAVVSGLYSLYFGKTFGTVSDYAGLILWGFAAKVTVDALAGAMDRWVSSGS